MLHPRPIRLLALFALLTSPALAQEPEPPVLASVGNPPRLVDALLPVQSAARACIPESDVREWQLRVAFEGQRVVDVQTESVPDGARADAIARCLQRALLNARLASGEGRVSWPVTATRVRGNFGTGGLGLAGTGRGGGGTGEGTIGLGNIGTIDHGSAMGPGYGRGSGPRRRRTRPPRVRLSETTVRGPISSDIVRRVVRRHFNQLRYCYEQHLQREEGAGGKLTIRWVITASGSVQTATVTTSSIEDPEHRMQACVVGRFRRFAFPAAAEGEGISVAQMELVFRPAE